jgi:uncharacterized protein YkwD
MRVAARAVVALLAAGCGGSSDGGSAPTTTTTQSGRGDLGDATEAATGEPEAVIGAPTSITPENADAVAGRLPHCPDDGLTINDGTCARAEESAACIVNKVRRRRGHRALKVNSRLYSAAQEHATDMVRDQYFSHVAKDGTTVVPRIRAAGYLSDTPDWTVGENLAWGSGSFSTPASIVQAWLNSPGHKRNLLNRKYREAGLAIAVGAPVQTTGDAGTYVQEFGKCS